MTPTEHLGAYAEGWRKGDSEAILNACAPGFTFHDPSERSEPFTRSEFPGYLGHLKVVVGRASGVLPDPFMKLSHVITSRTWPMAGGIVACCWWEIPGRNFKGTGLIIVGPEGVITEQVATK